MCVRHLQAAGNWSAHFVDGFFSANNAFVSSFFSRPHEYFVENCMPDSIYAANSQANVIDAFRL